MLTDAYVGRTLDQRYRLVEFMASGGMALLFRAVHVGTGRTLAVKLLRPELRENSDFVRRFQREARLTAQLKHEHVVDILDVQIEHECYLVMEYLSGVDLRTYLRRVGRAPWPQVQAMMLQICSALQCAHDHGIVHRDLKPANCFQVERTGRIKVLDFGIAKPLSPLLHDGPQITKTGTLVGTPEYMAPEQFCAEADHRADIYGAGVLMFELLTGTRPFRARGAGLLRQISCEPPPSFATIAGDLDCPPEVEAVVRRALAKQPEQRFADMRDFMRAIAACDRSSRSTEPPGSAQGDPSAEEAPEREAESSKTAAVGPQPDRGQAAEVGAPAAAEATAASGSTPSRRRGAVRRRRIAITAAGVAVVGVTLALALASRAEDARHPSDGPAPTARIAGATAPPGRGEPPPKDAPEPGPAPTTTPDVSPRGGDGEVAPTSPAPQPDRPRPPSGNSADAPESSLVADAATESPLAARPKVSSPKDAGFSSPAAIKKKISQVLLDEEVGALVSRTRVSLRFSPTGEVLEATVHGLPRGSDREHVESVLRSLRVRSPANTFDEVFDLPLP